MVFDAAAGLFENLDDQEFVVVEGAELVPKLRKDVAQRFLHARAQRLTASVQEYPRARRFHTPSPTWLGTGAHDNRSRQYTAAFGGRSDRCQISVERESYR